MPIYRQNEDGEFEPFEKTPFPDLERTLEDWIERNPYLLENEPLAVFARQKGTQFEKIADLLAVDRQGACVIIELKKGAAPRDVIAQTLEYAAWVDSLSLDELNEMAGKYANGRDLKAQSLEDLYRLTFGEAAEDEAEDSGESESLITFNNRQRLVIVAEEYPGEMEQTLRYLRTRLGVEITAVRFSVHRLHDETLIDTEIVVGRERATSASEKSSRPATVESHEETKERVDTDFLRDTVDGLEDWLVQHGGSRLHVQHNSGSNHRIRLGGKTVLTYYFARRWLHFYLSRRTEADEQAFAELIAGGDFVLDKYGNIGGNITNAKELDVLKSCMLPRLTQE